MSTASAADAPPAASPVADLNPIAWGQFHLRGGWKGFWPTTLGYTAVVGAGMVLIVRLSDPRSGALMSLKTAFTGLQAGLLVIFVATRVSTAVRQDQTSRMIESHRLTPMSPSQAVLGYLLGPSAQPLALCLANVLLGCYLCRVVGTSVALWLTLNAVLLLFAMFGTTLAAFGAFAGRPGGNAVGWIGGFVAMLNFITIGAILPAVNVLATPVLGSSIFDLRVAGRDAVEVYAPSTVFQFCIAAVCFAGACRRYRRDDRPALGWDLGLALLAAWVATSAYGIAFWDEYQPSVMRGQSNDPAVQFLGSTIFTMLLALVPLAGAAWQSTDWEGRRALGDAAPGRRPPAPLVVAVAATVLTLLLAAPASVRNSVGAPLDAVVRTGLVVLAFYAATVYGLRLVVRGTSKVLYPLLAWVALSFMAPLCVDYVGWWVTRSNMDGPTLGDASTFGSLGALIQVWKGDAVSTTAGIIFQLVVAAALAAAFHTTRPRWARTPS